METIERKEGESRSDYLLRAAIYYIDENVTNIYDEAECDGGCLIEDIKAHLNLD